MLDGRLINLLFSLVNIAGINSGVTIRVLIVNIIFIPSSYVFFAETKSVIELKGHLFVGKKYATPDGFELGKWI